MALVWPVVEPLRAFVKSWYTDAICDHLQAVTEGQIQRLSINVPPGVGKSLLVDSIWPSWEWGPKNMPQLRYVSSSYSQDLTIRNNRKTRAIIESRIYQKYWGNRFSLIGEQNSKIRFDNDKTGWKLATSVGGLGTGERGDRFIIDDGNNIKQVESDAIRAATAQWFREVVPTRVNDAKVSAFINIQQRTHEGDISGIIYSEQKHLNWVKLILPMEYNPKSKCYISETGFEDPREHENELLDPIRFPRKEVEDLKITLGPYAAAGQLAQTPSPRGGGMFKRTDWRFYSTVGGSISAHRPSDCSLAPAIFKPETFDSLIISVDASFKKTPTSAQAAIVVIGRVKARFYLLHYTAKQRSFSETLEAIKQVVYLFPDCRVLIEDKANGPGIIDMLSSEIPGIIEFQPKDSKEERAASISFIVESHNFFVADDESSREFIDQFANFPTAKLKDLVDATSQCLIYMLKNDDPIEHAKAMSEL